MRIEDVSFDSRAVVRRFGIALGLIATALLGGCFDYPSVGKLASTSASTVGAWQPLADDYVANCRRAVAFGAQIPQTQSVTALKQKASGGNDPCVDFVTTQVALNDSLTVLKSYFAALAAVSTDSNFTTDKGVEALGDAAGKLSGDTAEATAVAKLASVVADLVTSGIRGRAMCKLIDQTDNVSVVVAAIQHVIMSDYADNLRDEAANFKNSMYEASSGIHLTLKPCAGTTFAWPALEHASADQILFQSYYSDKCNSILVHQAAAAAFNSSATDLLNSLALLKKNRGRLKDQDVVSNIVKQAQTLFADAQAVRTAFAPAAKN